MLLVALLLAQWTAFGAQTDPRILLAGSWQSCALEDGYTERVYDRDGFELHLGPHDEFAIFVGVQEAHREHDSAENLLGPRHTVHDAETWRGRRTWAVPRLHLQLSIVEAGGSQESCDAFVVTLERTR